MTVNAIHPHTPETDGSIESSFKNSYVYQTYLKDDAVKTKARSGVVTLTGTVADGSHRTLAQETAANLPGVSRVDNNLSTRAEVDAENADTWIGRKVKLALLFHRNVSAVKTAVEVNDGVVTLHGEATSMAQKDLTSEYARDIDSVKEVRNMMTVGATPVPADRTAGEKLDDASVTAQVRTALLTHRSTKSVTPRVETRNGEITLTGRASSAAEKSLVTKLVTDIHGVTGVKNQMTVAQAVTR
jgi:osmotically-inducible protein OsmY